MFLRLLFTKLGVVLTAGVALLVTPTPARALFVVTPGSNNRLTGGAVIVGGGGIFGGGFSAFGGNNNQQTPQIQRATNTLSNPVNYWQYSQVTGVKPTIGTVRIYNQFGTLANQNGAANTGFGGNGGGFGGAFGGGGGTNLPGQGSSSGGDDPPQGVLLHVNYANMFFPNQVQLNQVNGGAATGGLGGFGGFNNNFGKYNFGHGGPGL